MNELEQAIAYYCSRGWRVVPIPLGHKNPMRPQWQQVASSDLGEATRLFGERSQWQGVGIVTGAGSGLFVLDVDVNDGKGGDDTLADLEHQHGPLPATYEVLTGRGGRHLYFRYPDGLVITNDAGGRLGPGLDIRGEGGQVLAPPSMSPEEGGGIYWRELDSPEEVASAPSWLLELLTSQPPQPRPQRPPAARSGLPGDLFEAAVTWAELLEADGAAFMGERHDRRTGHPYELWSRPGVSGHHGATLGYGGSDVLKVFTSSWPGLREGETYTRFGYYAATRHGGDFAAAARQLREEGYVPQQQHEEKDTTDEGPIPPGFFIDWSEFWSRDDAEEGWLYEPVIARGRGHALYATHKAGKSLLTMWLSLQIATGDEPVVVLYLDYEMGENDIRERFEDMGYGGEHDLSRLLYAHLPAIGAFDTYEGASRFLAIVDHVQGQWPSHHLMVVLDTTSRAVQGDENSADTIREYYRLTGLGLKKRGITSVRLDHAGKTDGMGQRGSSAKGDDVDIVWHLRVIENGITLHRDAARMGWVPEDVSFTMTEDPLSYRRTASGYQAGTKEVAQLLDKLGVPADASTRQAIAALKAAGQGKRRTVIVDACRWRRERADDGLI